MDLATLYARDIALAYREIGKPVVYQGRTTYGVLVNEPTEVLPLTERAYAVQATTLTLTCPTEGLGPVKNNTDIVVAGVTYQIVKPLPSTNGQETKLWLTGRGA